MPETLRDLAEYFGEITDKVYHYNAPDKSSPSYIVWAEDDRLDFEADNIHAEKVWQGTLDLFTKTEFDGLIGTIEDTFEEIGASYRMESVQYETDTGLIHYEWVWTYA